jgi:triacylglycerol lipase
MPRITPLRWRRWRLAAFPAVAVLTMTTTASAAAGTASRAAAQPGQAQPGPVVVVPGFGGGTTSLTMLLSQIRATGRQAVVVQLPGDGKQSLAADAAALNATVSSLLRSGAPPVDVIGYSSGGVVTLLWARQDGTAGKVRRVVTLGAPFHGTVVASLAAALLPGTCPATCQDLVFGNAALRQLTAAPVPAQPAWLSLWTIDDDTAVPADTANLPGAINVPVQTVCPALVVTHTGMPRSPAVIAMVLGAISPGPLRLPTAADCATPADQPAASGNGEAVAGGAAQRAADLRDMAWRLLGW